MGKNRLANKYLTASLIYDLADMWSKVTIFPMAQSHFSPLSPFLGPILGKSCEVKPSSKGSKLKT